MGSFLNRMALVSLSTLVVLPAFAADAFENLSNHQALTKYEDVREALGMMKPKALPCDSIVSKPQTTGRAYGMLGRGTGGEAVLDGPIFTLAFGTKLSDNVYLDIVHKNEGHADRNPMGIQRHRDDFGGELFYHMDFSDKLSAEAGAGLVATFNTTHKDGIQVDDKKLGAIVSAALIYKLRENLSVRAQYDQVNVPGDFSTKIVSVGLQHDFDAASTSRAAASDGKTEVSVMGGVTKMNRAAVKSGRGYQAEIRRYIADDYACSVSIINEGENEVSARRDIAGQCWYVKNAGKDWKLSAGVGPVLTQETRFEDDKTKLGALISIEAAYKVSKHTEVGGRFSRLAYPGKPARDSDLGMVFGRVKF